MKLEKYWKQKKLLKVLRLYVIRLPEELRLYVVGPPEALWTGL